MASRVSIFNEICKLNDTLLLYSGNLPKGNVMLRRQSERIADLSIDILSNCTMGLSEKDDLKLRLKYIDAIIVNLTTIDAIVKIWYSLPNRTYSKNKPIVVTHKQFAIYNEIYSNILFSAKRWKKSTYSQISEEPKQVNE